MDATERSSQEDARTPGTTDLTFMFRLASAGDEREHAIVVTCEHSIAGSSVLTSVAGSRYVGGSVQGS